MRGRTGSVIISGGSATYENFSNTIQDGNSAMDCATFWMKFTRRRDVRNSRIEIRESIHNSRCNVLNTLHLRLLLAARRDRQPRTHEALPRSSRRKRDRRQIPQMRSRPEVRKSQREPRQPSTRNPPVCDLYKYAPIPESHLAKPRLRRSLCLPPFRARCASNRIGHSVSRLSVTDVRNKDMVFYRHRSMRAQ